MPDLPRVLVVSPWGYVWAVEGGGGNPVLASLFTALADRGFDVDVVGPWSPRTAEFSTLGKGVRFTSGGKLRLHPRYFAGRPVVVFGSRALAYAELNLRLAIAGVRVARRRRPALVLALSTNTTPAAALIARTARARLVVQLLGAPFSEHLGSRNGRLEVFEDVLAFRFPVDHWVIHNDGTRGDRAAAALGVPSDRVSFWTHGIDVAACNRASGSRDARSWLGLEESTPLIVCASRLEPVKRVDRVLSAFPGVLRAFPQARLVISGDGLAAPALAGQAEEAGIADAVTFTGPLAREKNLDLIASATVFCAFGDQSNVGFTLIEALTCGAPVVVTDVGGTTEFVAHKQNGLVIPPDDTQAATAALNSLIGDPILRQRLSHGARLWAADHVLGEDERIELEMELYDEMLSAVHQHEQAPR